jgi:hypothetical protein
MKNQDRKNFWSWIKNKVKYSLIAFCIVGVAIVAADEISSNQIPADLQLKVAKEDIVQSFEYTQYEYKKDANGEDVLDESGNPIIAKTSQMIRYSYKSEELAPQLPDEVIEKRTENIVTRDLGNNQFAAQSGYDFYQENGEWKQIKSATTTKEVFNKATLSPISWLIENVFAANTASISPGTVADDATVGTVAWNNPDNAKIGSDSNYAIASNYDTTDLFSHYLKATNFGFSIPNGATINGILVEIQHYTTRDDGAKESAIKIVKSDGLIGIINKSTGANWNQYPEVYTSYGSSTDLWGESWDTTKINSSNFGVVASLELNGAITLGTAVAKVDHIRITVYYTEAVGGEASSPVIFKSGAVFRSGVIFK